MNLRAKILLSILLMLTIIPAMPVRMQEDASPEILWDTWGVPHIYAEDNANAFYAFGWAQMHSHANLILRLYMQARGQLAEIQGETALASDIQVHTLGIPQGADNWYAAQNEEIRTYLDAFAEGMNDYATAHPDLIADEWEAVLPITGHDPLALLLRDMIVFITIRQPDLGITTWQDAGSNAWAVAPSKSASGYAMHLGNSHLPWSDLFTYYEANIVTPDINMYGIGLVGTPVISQGFNHNLSWSFTVNTIDAFDLYELSLTPEGGYILDGETKPLDIQQHTLQVRQPDGTLAEHPLTVARSEHGPVIAKRDDGTALAVRIAGFDQPGIVEQFWDMGKATNLTEFEVAMSRLQIPMFNLIYADREGNILYLFNGQIPVRSEGDWAFWQGVVPGDRSDLIWTEYHAYEDLPRVLNPESGWLQNTNEPPWTATLPLELDYTQYPAYFAPAPAIPFRTQRSIRLLTEDDSITFDEFVSYKFSTRMELADRLLDELIAVAQASANPLAQSAAQVLAAWDRSAEVESQGAVLFATWWQRYSAATDMEFATPFDMNAELFTTPNGLADTEIAVTMLAEAATAVETTYGTLDIAWGEVYRLRVGTVDMPANGAVGDLGVFRVTTPGQPDENGQMPTVHGDTFVAFVEFSEPLRAEGMLSYGNASQPHSTHIGDQLEMYSQKTLRTFWITREQVETNLEMQETLGEAFARQ